MRRSSYPGPGVYAYCYDDAMGLLQCSADSNYELEFFCVSVATIAVTVPAHPPCLVPGPCCSAQTLRLRPLADAVLELCLGDQHSHQFLAYRNISYLHPHIHLVHYHDCFVHNSPQHPHLDPYIGHSDDCNCNSPRARFLSGWMHSPLKSQAIQNSSWECPSNPKVTKTTRTTTSHEQASGPL